MGETKFIVTLVCDLTTDYQQIGSFARCSSWPDASVDGLKKSLNKIHKKHDDQRNGTPVTSGVKECCRSDHTYIQTSQKLTIVERRVTRKRARLVQFEDHVDETYKDIVLLINNT